MFCTPLWIFLLFLCQGGGLSYNQDPGPSPRTVEQVFTSSSWHIPPKELFPLCRQIEWMGKDVPIVHRLFDFRLSPKLQKSKILYVSSTSERQVGGWHHSHLSQIALETSASSHPFTFWDFDIHICSFPGFVAFGNNNNTYLYYYYYYLNIKRKKKLQSSLFTLLFILRNSVFAFTQWKENWSCWRARFNMPQSWRQWKHLWLL